VEKKKEVVMMMMMMMGPRLESHTRMHQVECRRRFPRDSTLIILGPFQAALGNGTRQWARDKSEMPSVGRVCAAICMRAIRAESRPRAVDPSAELSIEALQRARPDAASQK
jgi:hypothetical protein